jgi:hypothetical protein
LAVQSNGHDPGLQELALLLHATSEPVVLSAASDLGRICMSSKADKHSELSSVSCSDVVSAAMVMSEGSSSVPSYVPRSISSVIALSRTAFVAKQVSILSLETLR